jgi:hypothetical protein
VRSGRCPAKDDLLAEASFPEATAAGSALAKETARAQAEKAGVQAWVPQAGELELELELEVEPEVEEVEAAAEGPAAEEAAAVGAAEEAAAGAEAPREQALQSRYAAGAPDLRRSR